jgi:hypothetical protein
MAHDATKVLMGSTQSSDKEVSVYDEDPASFPAGRAVRQTTGADQLSLSSGSLVGVSLGRSLSDHKKTAVARVGNRVPLELSGYKYLTKEDLTFYTQTAAAVAIEFLSGGTAGSEAVTVTGDDDAGYLISVEMEDGVSTGTQMKAALDGEAEALALIETIISGTAGDAQADFAEDDIDGVIGSIGAAVRVSATHGKAVVSGGTLTGACYASAGSLVGISEDGASEVPAALIDMGGGL